MKKCRIIKKSLKISDFLYPAPESNRHSFLSVFETDASTSSASWAFFELYVVRYMLSYQVNYIQN